MDGVGAAAVLVDPGAGVEPLGGQVGGLPVRCGLGAADDLAAAFQRAALASTRTSSSDTPPAATSSALTGELQEP
jgi:hypothetical protein